MNFWCAPIAASNRHESLKNIRPKTKKFTVDDIFDVIGGLSSRHLQRHTSQKHDDSREKYSSPGKISVINPNRREATKPRQSSTVQKRGVVRRRLLCDATYLSTACTWWTTATFLYGSRIGLGWVFELPNQLDSWKTLSLYLRSTTVYNLSITNFDGIFCTNKCYKQMPQLTFHCLLSNKITSSGKLIVIDPVACLSS